MSRSNGDPHDVIACHATSYLHYLPVAVPPRFTALSQHVNPVQLMRKLPLVTNCSKWENLAPDMAYLFYLRRTCAYSLFRLTQGRQNGGCGAISLQMRCKFELGALDFPRTDSNRPTSLSVFAWNRTSLITCGATCTHKISVRIFFYAIYMGKKIAENLTPCISKTTE